MMMMATMMVTIMIQMMMMTTTMMVIIMMQMMMMTTRMVVIMMTQMMTMMTDLYMSSLMLVNTTSWLLVANAVALLLWQVEDGLLTFSYSGIVFLSQE